MTPRLALIALFSLPLLPACGDVPSTDDSTGTATWASDETEGDELCGDRTSAADCQADGMCAWVDVQVLADTNSCQQVSSSNACVPVDPSTEGCSDNNACWGDLASYSTWYRINEDGTTSVYGGTELCDAPPAEGDWTPCEYIDGGSQTASPFACECFCFD